MKAILPESAVIDRARVHDSYPSARVSRRGWWDMTDACSLQTAGPAFCPDNRWVTPLYINSCISDAKALGAKLISIKTQTSISSIMESTGAPRAQMGFLLQGRENTHPAAFPDWMPNNMIRYFTLKLKNLGNYILRLTSEINHNMKPILVPWKVLHFDIISMTIHCKILYYRNDNLTWITLRMRI